MRCWRLPSCTSGALVALVLVVPSSVGMAEAPTTGRDAAATYGAQAGSPPAAASGRRGHQAAPPAAPSAGSGTRVVSRKKGASLWRFRGATRSLHRSGATWYWNWDTAHAGVQAPPGVEFVPMVWGPGSVTPERLAAAEANGSHLLAFNEPDHTDQANMTVEQALDLWPQLESVGLRLSSPAVADGGADPGGWLDRFMKGARERGHRVDFIALHWYGGDFGPRRATRQLRAYLARVHDRYGLPIWLTEYALMDFGRRTTYPTRAAQARFITTSTRMLESLRYVERYAWFALPAAAPWSRTGLFREGGAPTRPGRAYAAAGRPRGGR